MSILSDSIALPPLAEIINRWRILSGRESPLTVHPDLMVAETLVLMSQAQSSHDELRSVGTAVIEEPIDRDRHSCVLVAEGKKLLGILTERDIVRLIAQQRDLSTTRVSDVMTRDLVTLTQAPDRTALTVLSLFHQHQIRHLPIIDESGHLVAVVTSDLLWQILQPANLLKLRSIEEVMTVTVIHAPASTSILSIARQMTEHRVSCVVITAEILGDRSSEPMLLRPIGIITERDLVQFQTLGIEIDRTLAGTVMSSPVFCLHSNETLWRARQEMNTRRIQRVAIVADSGQLLGIVTQTSLLQVLEPTEVLATNEMLHQQVRVQTAALEQSNRELRQAQAELSHANDRIAQTVAERERALAQIARRYQRSKTTLRQQLDRHRLMMEMSQRIRQSLNLPEILQTTVDEVRQFLQTDRVLMLQFAPDFSGTVAVESVGSSWNSILDRLIQDPCLAETYLAPFREGHITVKNDIYTANIDPCHLELLASFQVRANLVVPILQGDNLWGLLIAHHCAALRNWQPLEVDLLRQLAIQVGIAIAQASLFDRARAEISARQQVEAALKVKSTELAELYHNAPCGYHSLDLNGTYISINNTELTMLGYTRAEVVGQKTFGDLLTPASGENFQANLSLLQQQGWIDDLEVEMVRKNGTTLPVSLSARTVSDRDGNYLMSRSVVLDISERVRIRAERKLADEKIIEQAALIDVATDAIFVCEIDRRIVFWSQGAERLYGWQADEVMGRDAIEMLRPNETDSIDSAYQTLLLQGAWQGQIHTKTKTDRAVTIESRWTLIRDTDGQAKSILLVNTDITEKQQLEQQFLRAQRLESLGTLASGIAHDMNNILTPILGISQLLPMRLPDVDDRSRSLIRILEESAKRGTALVQQILSFGRGSDASRSSVQIGYILAEVVRVIRQTFPKSIDIELNLATTDLWSISADPTQLHQVLMNLTINARDAMPHGGTLSIAAENLVLDESYVRLNADAKIGSYVAIVVSDTGTGISPEILARIFDPFFTTKAPDRGTGLGLATTLRIVKNHGGFMTVDSQVGQGTRFEVYLPAETSPEPEIADPLELPLGNGELVLVVDDELTVREIVKESLEVYNYRVITADDGMDAIALYAKHRSEIQFILLDLMMPLLDSASTVRALQKIDPHVPIIAMSGLSANEQTENLPNLNLQAFLTKPFTSQELLQVLHGLRVSRNA